MYAIAYQLTGIGDYPGNVLKVDRDFWRNNASAEQLALRNMQRWLGLLAGKGVEGLEQVIAFSAETPLTVSRFAHGDTLLGIANSNDKPVPTEADYMKLADTMRAVIEKGIATDLHTRNMLYDPISNRGFTIIDYSLHRKEFRYNPDVYSAALQGLKRTLRVAFGDAYDASSFNDMLRDFTQPVIDDLA